MEAVKLFSKEGYEAVSVEQIAKSVGIKAPSLYKHYKSKQDIFDSILLFMEQRDFENAAACSMPTESSNISPEDYSQTSIDSLIEFSRNQFRYWTEDDFASSFRKMLTVEQYRSRKMNSLYHQYLGTGPLEYVVDLLGSRTEALAFYGPMFLLYSVYDESSDKESVCKMLDSHLERWKNEF